MSRILAITGATGRKSGGAFASLISQRRDEIDTLFSGGMRALVRSTSNTEELLAKIPDIELFSGEITDEKLLETFLEGVDTLVHIAGIRFSCEIVRAAAKCKVRRLLLVHTTGMYSKFKSASEGYKSTEEEVYRLCKEAGIILSICRPTMIYGNIYDKNIVEFTKMVDKFPIMPVVNGARYKLQPVHFEDLAKAYYAILTNEEKTGNKDYTLSGGSAIELREILTIIGENLGKKVRFLSCPFFLAYAGSWLLYILTFTKKDMREKVQRLCEERTFSFEEAARDFGYAPREFSEGVKAEVREYLENKK